MSSAPEFTVFLVGSDVLADRTLQRHLSRLYSVRMVQSAAEVEKLMRSHAPGRENDSMTRALQETYHFDKQVFASEKVAEVFSRAPSATGSACSSRPITAPSSSTRSPTSRPPCR